MTSEIQWPWAGGEWADDAFGEPGINMVSGRKAGGRVLILDYLLLVKLDAPRRFREYLLGAGAF